MSERINKYSVSHINKAKSEYTPKKSKKVSALVSKKRERERYLLEINMVVILKK